MSPVERGGRPMRWRRSNKRPSHAPCPPPPAYFSTSSDPQAIGRPRRRDVVIGGHPLGGEGLLHYDPIVLPSLLYLILYVTGFDAVLLGWTRSGCFSGLC